MSPPDPGRRAEPEPSLRQYVQGGRTLGHVVFDAEGVIRDLDEGISELFGYQSQFLVGAFFFSFIHARDVSPVLKDVVDLIHQRKQQAAWAFRFRAADGQWRWIKARARSGPGDPAESGIQLALADGMVR